MPLSPLAAHADACKGGPGGGGLRVEQAVASLTGRELCQDTTADGVPRYSRLASTCPSPKPW